VRVRELVSGECKFIYIYLYIYIYIYAHIDKSERGELCFACEYNRLFGYIDDKSTNFSLCICCLNCTVLGSTTQPDKRCMGERTNKHHVCFVSGGKRLKDSSPVGMCCRTSGCMLLSTTCLYGGLGESAVRKHIAYNFG